MNDDAEATSFTHIQVRNERREQEHLPFSHGDVPELVLFEHTAVHLPYQLEEPFGRAVDVKVAALRRGGSVEQHDQEAVCSMPDALVTHQRSILQGAMFLDPAQDVARMQHLHVAFDPNIGVTWRAGEGA